MIKGFKLKYLVLIVLVAGIIWMLKDSFFQPGVKDLSGNFEEIAFNRNENNTGPVNRIYAVSVADTLFKEMIAYGNLQPHTKYGTTKVYFFRNRTLSPKSINVTEPHFNLRYNADCIGVYTKNGMSEISFAKGL
ncbi:MAG: hypothetical protein H7096_09660 [Flavobacterium sp.]|nr:hypothetical protein [Pedobacter sp.]